VRRKKQVREWNIMSKILIKSWKHYLSEKVIKVIRLGKRAWKESGEHIRGNPAVNQQSSTTEGGGKQAVNIATNKQR